MQSRLPTPACHDFVRARTPENRTLASRVHAGFARAAARAKCRQRYDGTVAGVGAAAAAAAAAVAAGATGAAATGAGVMRARLFADRSVAGS